MFLLLLDISWYMHAPFSSYFTNCFVNASYRKLILRKVVPVNDNLLSKDKTERSSQIFKIPHSQSQQVQILHFMCNIYKTKSDKNVKKMNNESSTLAFEKFTNNFTCEISFIWNWSFTYTFVKCRIILKVSFTHFFHM